MPTPGIKIQTIGLKDFPYDLALASAAMRVIDSQAGPLVIEGVRLDAQSAAWAQGGIASKASSDITTSGNELVYGGQGFSMGAEFGAIKWPQFEPWLGNGVTAGYFLYPAIRDWERNKGPELYWKYMAVAIAKAFPSGGVAVAAA
jgi:hypothetical protein